MTVVEISNTNHYTGLSGDTKPVAGTSGSTFFETDTGHLYKSNGSTWFFVQLTVTDPNLDIARGLVGDVGCEHKFGANVSVAASSTEKVAVDGVMGFLTVADNVRIKAGGNAADDAAGVGAQSITVQGVDATGVEIEEDIVTAGASASAATTLLFFRVTRAFVKDVGAYGVRNTGKITIEDEAGTTDLVVIDALKGQTQTTLFFVPLGKAAYLTRIAPQSASTKAADVEMYQRRDALDITTPFTGARLVINANKLITEAPVTIDSYIMFPALTDLFWEATTASGAVAEIAVNYDLKIVDV